MTIVSRMASDLKLWNIMFGYARERVDQIKNSNKLVAHYTTAETAIQIIKGRSIWLRSAAVMNDHSEIEYGRAIIDDALGGELGKRLKDALDNVRPGTFDSVIEQYRRTASSSRETTFMTALCEHAEGDRLGRLSMWRAYGGPVAGVALLFDRSVVAETTGAGLCLNASPVLYADKTIFCAELQRLVDRLDKNLPILKAADPIELCWMASGALLFAMLSIKHKGFAEEEEWRLLYLPELESSPHIQPVMTSVRGTPQRVYAIPFHDPAKPAILPHMKLDALLKGIIIGPCLYPETVRRSFVEQMLEVGIANAGARVHVSDIPLRQWG